MLKILWFVYLLKALGIAHISWQFLIIITAVIATWLIAILVLIFKLLK